MGAAVTAWAGNGARPRVPPSFLDGECIATIDRSQGTPLSLAIGIPFEDVELTADEPPDGRTFQFFAMCREQAPLRSLPTWLDVDDIERARQFDPGIEPPSDDAEILALAPAWATPGHDGVSGSCVREITTKAERMPISCEATASGVDWDAAAAPAGTYVVWGYTFEPPQSLWTRRPGLVRVHDGDPDALGPAVSLIYPSSDVDVTLEAGVRIEGCALGPEGTTVELAWATAPVLDAGTGDPWTPFADRDAGEGAFEVDFMPPDALLHQAVFFRAVARDPDGRTWTSYTDRPVVVLDGCDVPQGGRTPLVDACGVGKPPRKPDGASAAACEAEPPQPSDDPPDDPDGGSSEGEMDEGPPPGADDDDAGADTSSSGCRAAPSETGGGGPVALAGFALVLAATGVRRRSPSCR
jgi:MYXO-CTERM domain-containing protein